MSAVLSLIEVYRLLDLGYPPEDEIEAAAQRDMASFASAPRLVSAAPAPAPAAPAPAASAAPAAPAPAALHRGTRTWTLAYGYDRPVLGSR